MNALAPMAMNQVASAENAELAQFVAIRLADQLIGLPIRQVRDVFPITAMTPVPLAPPAVAGLVNLRGRIMLVYSLARLLGLEARPDHSAPMAIGLDRRGETVGVIVDSVIGVLAAPANGGEPVPAHVGAAWSRHARRVHQFETQLMIEIDLNALLDQSLNQVA